MRCLFLIAVLVFANASYGAETLAVLPIKNLADSSVADQSALAYEALTQAFAESRRFRLIERGQILNVVEELKLQNSGIVDERTAATIGKQAGAHLAVLSAFSGSISSFQHQDYFDKQGKKTGEYNAYPIGFTLDLRLVNVETGIVIHAFKVNGESALPDIASGKRAAIESLQSNLSREISNAFPLTGYIIKEKSNNEYLTDLGSSSGAVVGDYFILYEDGEDFIHPVTKKIIKGDKKVIGEGKITSIQAELSVLEITDKRSSIVVGQTKLESRQKSAGIANLLEGTKDFLKGLFGR